MVFSPQYRKKAIYGSLRRYLGEVLRRLAQPWDSAVEEGHLLADHVHMMLSIPPKYSVAPVIGYIQGKRAIHIAREFAGRPRNFVGQHFLARGYFVSTVDRDEQVIRAYIQEQELEARRQDQIVESMRRGMHPKDAGLDGLKRIKENTVEKRLLNRRGAPAFGISFYALKAKGQYAGVAMAANERSRYAVCTENGAELVALEPLLSNTATD